MTEDFTTVESETLRTQIWVGAEEPKASEVTEPANGHERFEYNKPDGCFWTSPVQENGKSAWWNYQMDVIPSFVEHKTEYWIAPESGKTMLSIPDSQTAEQVYEAYPDNREYARYGKYDWEQLAEEYGGIVVGEDAVEQSEYLEGWDVPTVVWFGWCVADYREGGRALTQ